MNEEKMLDAIRRAYPNGPPTGVDQVWYADTSIASDLGSEILPLNFERAAQ